MRSKNTFRQRLFIYYFSVYALFGIILLVFQYSREKRYKTDELDSSLDQIAAITNKYIGHNNILETGRYHLLDSLHVILPNPEIRITVISRDGLVNYDSSVDDESAMENHIDRPEVVKAINHDRGANIRKSATTGLKYYYFARAYEDYFIRVAVRYDLEVQNFLEAERTFWFVFLAVFIIIWLVLLYVTGKIGEAITKLKEFTIQLKTGKPFPEKISFPDNELGFIGREINDIYYRLSGTRDELLNEKERLMSHLNALNEGVGIFSKDRTGIYHNNNFINFLNLIGDKPVKSAEKVFELPSFDKINTFLHHYLSGEIIDQQDDLPRMDFIIKKNGKYFNILCVFFPDYSFEINITDVTKPEKRRIIKQQMTANIAHELKTPVASVIGYIETIVDSPELDENTKRNFLEKAYSHAERLADLINDLVVLNKIEEASEHFEIDDVDVQSLLTELEEFYHQILQASHSELKLSIPENVKLKGNKSLLHSIFQNLLENSIKYAGSNAKIEVEHYLEDKDYHYFSFRDNGPGVDPSHLNRLFERFYRVDKGRTRKTGGTGLGLAIVKNAILLHKGDINVKNRKEGGLEFLITLPKAN